MRNHTGVASIAQWIRRLLKSRGLGFDPGSGPFRGRVGRVHDADEVELSLGHGDGDLQVVEIVESKCELFDLKRY